MPSLLALNAAVALSAWIAAVPTAPDPLRMLCSAALVLVLPGLAWLGIFRGVILDLPRLCLAVVGLSSLWLLAGFALMATTLGAPSRWLLVAVIAAVVNAGLLVAGPPPRLRSLAPWRLLVLVASVGFVVTSLSATKLVPPLEDHDMEVRGTAYGLASRFKPYFQSNREVYLPMAHPILFHFHVAGSLIVAGEIEATRPSYMSALASERAARRGEEFPWMDRWWADYRAFVEDPALVGTRAPSALFAALVLCLLAEAIFRLTGSRAASLAGAALYMVMPETVVRSAYAGYFSVTVFAMLVGASLFEHRRQGSTKPDGGELFWLAAAGAFAALVDHKTVILILGVGALAALGWAKSVLRAAVWNLASFWRAIDRRALALMSGFAGGTFLWWGYGLAVHSATFVRDHLRMHIAHRILLNDLRVTHDPDRYAPSMVELWLEFGDHTGYFFLPVALAGILVWLARHKTLDLASVLAAWFVVGAVLYTLTDWRQTKHLMNELAPLVIAAVVLVWGDRSESGDAQSGRSRLRSWKRYTAGAALAFSFFFAITMDIRLIRDFRSLTISGASDIDGW